MAIVKMRKLHLIAMSYDKDAVLNALQRTNAAEVTLHAETQDTIPLVEFDSRLGYEPSMEYMTDKAHIEWKLNLLRDVMEKELPSYYEK